MYNTAKSSHCGVGNSKRQYAPTRADFFTGGKLPEFAIFYNIAFFRLAGYINYLQGNSYEGDKRELENVFGKWKAKVYDGVEILGQSAYSKLRNYLWKAYMFEKNSSGFTLEEKDINLINEIIFKLNHIRNFHSHIWHDNKPLTFTKELSEFIEELHENAIMAQRKDNKLSYEVSDYLEDYCDSRKTRKPGRNDMRFFEIHDGKHIITQDGRVFFLSLFLTRGEMNRFLQLKKGFKRNDLPKFKIKRRIFQHYTHRDGASRNYYGFEENVLDSLPLEQKEETLATRQTFKLISYLNDIPAEVNDPDLFPLFLSPQKKVEKASDMISWCEENQLLPDFKLALIEKENEEKEAYTLDGTLDCHLSSEPAYSFQLSVKTLHRLILDSLREKDSGDHIIKMLKVFIEERQWLNGFINLLPLFKEKDEQERITDREKLEEYILFKLRANDFVKKKMAKWLNNFDKGNLSTSDDKYIIFKEHLETAAIELNYYAFSFEQDRKPRAYDRFMEFSVQYLMDFDKTPNWEWMFESFETKEKEKEVWDYGLNRKVMKKVNTRNLIFAEKTPTKARIVINEHHVTLRLKEHPHQLFAMGYRTMKNLMTAIIEGKDIKAFINKLIGDINKVNRGEANELEYLTENELPEFMMKNLSKPKAHDKLKKEQTEKAQKRIDFIIDELSQYIEEDKAVRKPKAEKNRQIMRCYKYFEWNYADDNKFKFLRKDEYQRMSVYHYSLSDIGKLSIGDRKNRYAFLLDGIKEHMPLEIKKTLESAEHIDDLLRKVSISTIEKLKAWKANCIHYNRKKLNPILSKLGISHQTDFPENAQHIPFNIHPLLPIKVFFADKGDIKKLSLSKMIRESDWTKHLYQPHYQYEKYLAYLPDDKKSQKRKLIGQINNVFSKDAILWFMTHQYLGKTNPAIRDLVLQNITENQQWSFGNLRHTHIPFPLDIDGIGKVNIELKFHQLDDHLLLESKPMIKALVKQLFLRYENPEQLENVGVTKKDGSYTILLDEVAREMQRVQNHSYIWAAHLLLWEKKVIEGLEPETINQLEKHEKGFDRIGFQQVLNLKNIEPKLVKKVIKLRNTAFHANIPVGWTYEQMETDKALCDLLNYQKKEKIDYEISNKDI